MAVAWMYRALFGLACSLPSLCLASWAMAPAANAIVVSDPQAAVTEFIFAAGRGDLKEMEAILRVDPDVINRARVDKDGRKHLTAIHQAASQGRADSIRFLASHAADLNAVDHGTGARPLHNAARTNHGKAIEALLDAGADLNGLSVHPTDRSIGSVIKTWPDDTPLDVAAACGAKDAVAILLQRGAKLDGNPPECPQSALHPAVSCTYGTARKINQMAPGNRDVIDLLVKSGADFSTKNFMGQQPVHKAVEGLCPDTLEYILDKYRDRIDINAEGPSGYRPLAYAVVTAPVRQRKDDRVQVVKLLKKHGADISLACGPATPPLRPLEYAIQHNREEDVLKLLR